MKKWHPDKHKDDIDTATKMSSQINEAYETVLTYCNNYDYPFDEESLKKTSLSPQEWWDRWRIDRDLPQAEDVRRRDTPGVAREQRMSQ